MELQTRLKVFKQDFNTFYARSLRSYGKWRHNNATPSVGSIVYILDKTLPKQNFLQKFAVGKITRYLSDHTVELTYVKQSPKMTQSFIGALRTGQTKSFGLKTCTRDLRSLGLLVDPSESSAWDKGVDIDQLMVIEPAAPVEPVEPAETAEHVEPVNPVESLENIEPIEPVEPIEHEDPVEPVDPVETIETMDTMELMDTAIATTDTNSLDINEEAITRPQRKRHHRAPHWHQQRD